MSNDEIQRHIASDSDEMIRAVSVALEEDGETRLAKADAFLKLTSWDITWEHMSALIDDMLARREKTPIENLPQAAQLHTVVRAANLSAAGD